MCGLQSVVDDRLDISRRFPDLYRHARPARAPHWLRGQRSVGSDHDNTDGQGPCDGVGGVQRAQLVAGAFDIDAQRVL